MKKDKGVIYAMKVMSKSKVIWSKNSSVFSLGYFSILSEYWSTKRFSTDINGGCGAASERRNPHSDVMRSPPVPNTRPLPLAKPEAPFHRYNLIAFFFMSVRQGYHNSRSVQLNSQLALHFCVILFFSIVNWHSNGVRWWRRSAPALEGHRSFWRRAHQTLHWGACHNTWWDWYNKHDFFVYFQCLIVLWSVAWRFPAQRWHHLPRFKDGERADRQRRSHQADRLWPIEVVGDGKQDEHVVWHFVLHGLVNKARLFCVLQIYNAG